MEEERRFKEFLMKELYLLREALECKGFWTLSGEVNREITLRERIAKKSIKD